LDEFCLLWLPKEDEEIGCDFEEFPPSGLTNFLLTAPDGAVDRRFELEGFLVNCGNAKSTYKIQEVVAEQIFNIKIDEP
jgi:hypothetical protein